VLEGWTPPGAGPPVHRHRREDETFYVLAGEAILAPASTRVFDSRGIPHSFKSIGDPPARMLFLIQSAGFESFFEELTQVLASGPPDPAKLAALAAQYVVEFEK
jgi:hypothetical protein